MFKLKHNVTKNPHPCVGGHRAGRSPHDIDLCMKQQKEHTHLARFGATVPSYGLNQTVQTVETTSDTSKGTKLEQCRMVRDEDGNMVQKCS
jgi:hypothetical protein